LAAALGGRAAVQKLRRRAPVRARPDSLRCTFFRPGAAGFFLAADGGLAPAEPRWPSSAASAD